MKLLKTKQERLSARLTALIAVLLALLLFIVGPPYMDPPLEYGVSVNFGTSTTGSTNTQPKIIAASNSEQLPEPIPQNTPIATTSKLEVKEDILTNETTDITITKSNQDDQKKAEAEANRLRQQEINAQKKKKLDDLMGNIGSESGDASDSQGDERASGDKGQLNGDPYAPSYFGSSGNGNGGLGYGLNGRGTPESSKVIPDCDEEGRVVVEIHVDRNGDVTDAIPGKRGTTGDICLYDAAKRTAMTHKWSPDSKAPIKQIGFVIVDFTVRQ